MSAHAIALLAAAAGVGFGHAILPDHWVPLAVLGRTRRYPLTRVARLSAAAGVAHVLVSMILGAVLIAIGLQFRHAIESAENIIVGGLLLATGLAFAILDLTGHGHHHDHSDEDGHHHHDHGDHHHDHEHEHHHEHGERPSHGLLAVMLPFGAAASPDLTILPVFLAAAAVGPGTAVSSVVVFGAVTIATIVGLTLGATRGGYEVRGEWLEEWGNLLTAGALVAIGVLILTGIL